MAGLAADVDLCPGGGEAIIYRVVVLAYTGRMALGAHEVPILIQLSPMQDVVVANLLIRIEVEPALAATVLRPAVPGDRECLQTPIRELDQILLQWIEAERVFELEWTPKVRHGNWGQVLTGENGCPNEGSVYSAVGLSLRRCVGCLPERMSARLREN